MLRAMYSGISGLKNFQSKLDVVGNNIANVNTFGYKKGRVTFKDLVSQQVGSATGANAVSGGTNPKEVGLGGTMATVDNVYNQGAMQNTGRALDVGISGEGFFALNVNGQTQYTRAGNFYTDNAGDIVNGDGSYLLSTTGQKITIPAGAKSLSIGKDGQVSYVNDAGVSTQVGQIQIVTFANNAGLSKVGV